MGLGTETALVCELFLWTSFSFGKKSTFLNAHIEHNENYAWRCDKPDIVTVGIMKAVLKIEFTLFSINIDF